MEEVGKDSIPTPASPGSGSKGLPLKPAASQPVFSGTPWIGQSIRPWAQPVNMLGWSAAGFWRLIAPQHFVQRGRIATVSCRGDQVAHDLWLAAGLRTAFAKVDGAFGAYDAIALSVPVVQAMCNQLKDGDR